ncbi:unnamed protein product [Laminaria digitata]
MRVANGSQPFRRDPEGALGRSGEFRLSEGRRESGLHHEIEPLIGLSHDRHDHPEELSVHRIPILVRRCAFPFARRIPRILTRRTAQFFITVWLCWIVAACAEWRAQHNLKTLRKQLVAFLQETTFYVEEEGRLSEAWQSPLQRRLASDFDEAVHASAHAGRSPNGSASRSRTDGAGRLRGATPGEQTHRGDARGPFVASDGGRETLSGTTRLLQDQAHEGSVGSAKSTDKAEVESDGPHSYFESGDGENNWAHDRGLRSQGVREKGRDNSCPLIYAVDAVTAKEHGLHLFQEELELLGTVTARLCRCLCDVPIPHAQGQPEEPRGKRSAMTAANNGQETDDGQASADTVRVRRKLGVCKGEAHTLMLEEMLKGANVVISGDSGWFYEWFASMQDAYHRTCSHFSTRSTLGIPEGTVLRTVLTGTDMYEDSWFQLEGAGWRPFRNPIDAVRHGFNFMQYKLRSFQVGPVGKSTHTDLEPMMVSFDGCVSTKGPDSERADGSSNRWRKGRLLSVPKLDDS